MKAMQCELCGSTDILKDGDFFVCQNCGTKYTPENAKKMMVEGVVQVEGTVKVDSSSQIENYLAIGTKAYESKNYQEAENYANQVLEQDNTNYEAWLLKGQAAGWQSSVGIHRISETIVCFGQAVEQAPEEEVENVKQHISNESCLLFLALTDSAAQLAQQNPDSKTYAVKLLDTVTSIIKYELDITNECGIVLDTTELHRKLARMLQETAAHILLSAMHDFTAKRQELMARCKAYQTSSDYFRSEDAGLKNDYCSTLQNALGLGQAALGLLEENDNGTRVLIYTVLCETANQLIENDFSDYSARKKLYDEACEWYAEGMKILPGSFSKVGQIKRPVSPEETASTSGGCYVATAVYGSYDCPQVWTLRRYRDYELAESLGGRVFIKTYYAISPTLVKWFGHTDWFKRMWRGKLDRMVSDLQTRGFASTPYQDRNW